MYLKDDASEILLYFDVIVLLILDLKIVLKCTKYNEIKIFRQLKPVFAKLDCVIEPLRVQYGINQHGCVLKRIKIAPAR